jgi:hypothetical protein
VLVDRGRGRLDDVDVLASDVFEYFDVHLAVREPAYLNVAEGLAEVSGYFLSKRPIGVA